MNSPVIERDRWWGRWWRELRRWRRGIPALPYDYEPGPPVSKEDYERAMRAYRSIRQHSSGETNEAR